MEVISLSVVLADGGILRECRRVKGGVRELLTFTTVFDLVKSWGAKSLQRSSVERGRRPDRKRMLDCEKNDKNL